MDLKAIYRDAVARGLEKRRFKTFVKEFMNIHQSKSPYVPAFVPKPNVYVPGTMMELITEDKQRVLFPINELEEIKKMIGDRTYTLRPYVPEEKK